MPVQLRDLPPEGAGSCDWGGCWADSVAERFSAELKEWLPVCEQHAGRRERRPSVRGECVHCGKEYVLTVDGLVRLHSDGWQRCIGSGEGPRRLAGEAT